MGGYPPKIILRTFYETLLFDLRPPSWGLRAPKIEGLLNFAF